MRVSAGNGFRRHATRVRKHRGFAAEVIGRTAATARYRPLLRWTYSPEGAELRLCQRAKSLRAERRHRRCLETRGRSPPRMVRTL